MSAAAPGGEARSGGALVRVQGLCVVGVVLLSFAAIFVRLAAVSPWTAAFFRALYALPILWLVAWRLGLAQRRRRARWLAVLSGVLLAVDLGLWHRAIELIGAGLATVLVNTQVVFVGMAAWLLHRERPHARTFFVIPCILLGVLLISGLGRGDAFGADPVHGAALGLLAAFAYTGFLLLFRASQDADNRVVALAEATLGAILGALLGGLLAGNLALQPTWPAHGWLLALALTAHIAGWLSIAVALPRLPALETSVMLVLQPVLTMLWAALLFGERASPVQWAGVAMVIGGVAFLSARGSVRRREDGDQPAAGTAG